MSRRAYLFLEADRRVYRCQFTKDLTIIGSAPDADIIIKDSSVLGHHAQIARTGESYTLRAIDRSDVRVDGERVVGAHDLSLGERIGVGDAEILFVREQPESSTTVRLILERPGEPSVGFWTAKSTITVGRERGDLIIDDPLVSRVHCVIENHCAGGQFLLDARSERGTAVNGVSIDTRYRIVEGDVISLGGVKLTFETGAVARTGAGEAGARGRAAAKGPTGAANAPGSVGEGQGAAIPRNPYQRYPSQINAGVGRSDPNAPIRRASVDLRSGVSTGIVDPAAARAARERARHKSEHPGHDRSASERASEKASDDVRPDAPRAEPLPTFKPRPGWGAPDGGRRFDEDVSTRISHVGETLDKGEGLWYLPKSSGGGSSGAGRSDRASDARAGQAGAGALARPIIRPRGDAVPSRLDGNSEVPTVARQVPAAPAASALPYRPSDEGRAAPSIRRPDAGELRPMAASVPAAPREREPIPEPVPRRTSDGGRAPESRAGEARPGASRDERAPPQSAGAGPRGDGRWYLPESGGRAAPRRQGEPSYYVPASRSDSGGIDPDESLKREFRRPKFGGKTQGFDPSSS